MLDDIDWEAFWEEQSPHDRKYVEPAPDAHTVARVERILGYRLPAAYVAAAQHQNGGFPSRACHRVATRTTWAEDHVALHAIFSIGTRAPYSLCGERGSRFWIEEWEYPEIGIYFADCPSAGHDMLCLDYRQCGPQGEPRVVHVDQEWDYQITLVAESFEAFVRGLVACAAFDTDDP